MISNGFTNLEIVYVEQNESYLVGVLTIDFAACAWTKISTTCLALVVVGVLTMDFAARTWTKISKME